MKLIKIFLIKIINFILDIINLYLLCRTYKNYIFKLTALMINKKFINIGGGTYKNYIFKLTALMINKKFINIGGRTYKKCIFRLF